METFNIERTLTAWPDWSSGITAWAKSDEVLIGADLIGFLVNPYDEDEVTNAVI